MPARAIPPAAFARSCAALLGAVALSGACLPDPDDLRSSVSPGPGGAGGGAGIAGGGGAVAGGAGTTTRTDAQPPAPSMCTRDQQMCPPNTEAPRITCWDATSPVSCDTVTRCGGMIQACRTMGWRTNCDADRCSEPGYCMVAAGATMCAQCLSRRCCEAAGDCQRDTVCSSQSMGAKWTRLMACRTAFCPTECPAGVRP